MSFTTPNDRIFYACQAVLVVDRNTPTGDTKPTDAPSTYLTGVQSIGVNANTPSSSLLDVGRFQRQFHYYEKQEIEINIERVIDKNSNFFYNVTDANYQTGYKESHMFYKENINVQGAEASSFCIKNYDITLIYSKDDISGIGADRNNSSGNSNVDRNESLVVTYRNCLLTNISYSINTDGSIRESLTLFTRFADYTDSAENALVKLTEFNSAQLPRADTDSETPGTPQSGDTVKGYDVKFRPPSLTRYSGDVLRRKDTSTSPDSYFSILPDEVELMFDLSNSLSDLKITGINGISIDVSIDYSEILDVGRWTGSHTSSAAAGDTEFGQGLQNLWRYVNLPIAVSASFTGTARHAFPHDIKNGSPLFTKAADFNASLGKPEPTKNAADDAVDWNRVDRPILITAQKRVDDGGGPVDKYFVWDLGEHNYLTDISTSGGDAGGGNVEVTMSYQNDYSEAVFAKHTSVEHLSFDGPY